VFYQLKGGQDQGLLTGRERYHTVPRTLCFITCGDEVLLLKGAPNKRIWANRYNGVGGHVEKQEDVFTAALREIREETGLTVEDLCLCGIVNVDAGHPQRGVMLFVFLGRVSSRQVYPSAEGELEWVAISDLDHYDLVEDLGILLSRALAMRENGVCGQPFFARSYYNPRDQLQVEFSPACQM